MRSDRPSLPRYDAAPESYAPEDNETPRAGLTFGDLWWTGWLVALMGFNVDTWRMGLPWVGFAIDIFPAVVVGFCGAAAVYGLRRFRGRT